MSTIECKLCRNRGKAYRILSVRSRNIKHLAKVHGLCDEYVTAKGGKGSENSESSSDGGDSMSLSHETNNTCSAETTNQYQFDDEDDGRSTVSSHYSNNLSIDTTSSASTLSSSEAEDQMIAQKSGKEKDESTLIDLPKVEKLDSGNVTQLIKLDICNHGYDPSSLLSASQLSSASQTSTTSALSALSTEVDQERVEFLLAAWAHDCDISPHHFNSLLFRDAMSILNPYFRPPDNDAIIDRINSLIQSLQMLEAARTLCHTFANAAKSFNN